MKRAAGGVALTMVLIRGFCGGGVFLGYLGIEGLLLIYIIFNYYINKSPLLVGLQTFSYNSGPLIL